MGAPTLNVPLPASPRSIVTKVEAYFASAGSVLGVTLMVWNLWKVPLAGSALKRPSSSKETLKLAVVPGSSLVIVIVP